MRRQQPKKSLVRPRLSDKAIGNTQRRLHAESIVEDAPVFPKPLEYEDIDKSFLEWVENGIPLVIKGKVVPTFTLFSSQRFSEYSQTWSHTDENNNLLMNFKTVSRSPNPDPGENQGGLWNIPGDRHYTMLMRNVMEDDGKEVVEVFSMKQPYAVNMMFRVSFMTNEFANLNAFNQQINNLFKARQCYVTVNGHYIPMLLDDISDETKYGVEEQKFYVQTATIKVMAYIIHESDFKIDKFPKDVRLGFMGEKEHKKPMIDIDEYYSNENLHNRRLDVYIDLKPWSDKVEFDIDTDMDIETFENENVRTFRCWVNSEPVYVDRGFSVKENDTIRFKIFPYDPSKESRIVMRGYNPNVVVNSNETPEFVSDTIENYERIDVD